MAIKEYTPEELQRLNSPVRTAKLSDIQEPDDWQTISGNGDWKTWQDQDGSAQPKGNKLQRVFDNLTTVTPEQEKTPSWMSPTIGAGVNQLQKFGAKAIQSIGQPIVHPLQTVQGAVDTVLHPIDTATGMYAGAKKDPAGTLGSVAGALITGGLGAEAGESLLAKIPTRAKAMRAFESVAKDAADQPVRLTRTAPHLQKMMQLGKEGGGAVPLPVRQLANVAAPATPKSVPLLRAMQNDLNGVSTVQPMAKPLLYPSARNFQSGLASLSREDAGNMSGPMKGQLKQLNKAFYGDVHDAATAAGRGDDYAKAMRTYSRAANLGEIAGKLKKWALPGVMTGAGLSQVPKLMRAFE